MTQTKAPSSFVETGLIVNQSVAAAGNVKSPNGGLFQGSMFAYVEYVVLVSALTGSPTNISVFATESDANTAAGQADISGASIAFTGAEIAGGKSKSFQVDWRGRKEFAGVRVTVTGGTSAWIMVVARGYHTRDTAEVAALSTVVTAATLA